MPAFAFPRVVNNTEIAFSASLDLFTINGVPITDFSIFADAVDPVLVLIDSTQPTGKRTIIPATLDFTVLFQFTCNTVVLDMGGAGGIGMEWIKQNNLFLPNVWHWCFQADKGATSTQYTMELETLGVDPRPEDVSIP